MVEPAAPTPVPGTAILDLGRSAGGDRALVVADLHLGLGVAGGQGFGLADATARRMAEEIDRVGRARRLRRLIVAGDVKHPIVGAPPPVRTILFDFFSTLLRTGFEIEVILGNHDVGLAPLLPKEVRVRPAAGLRRGPIGLFHGHAWPGPNVLRAPTLVAGHLHPGYRLAPAPGAPEGKQRCWIRTHDWVRPRPRRGARDRELIVLPAFHPLAGIESLNRSPPARGRTFLVHRFVAPGRSRAYLLDGTDLGEIPSWGVPRARRSAPPDR